MSWIADDRYRRNYADIDWSDLKRTPSKPKTVTDRAAFHVIRDIDPYRSVVDGKVIGGRRQHREHLREHDLTEVGNERNNRVQPHYDMPSAKADLAIEMKKRGIIG